MNTRGTHGLLILYLKPEPSLFFPEQYSIETDQDLGPLAAVQAPGQMSPPATTYKETKGLEITMYIDCRGKL